MQCEAVTISLSFNLCCVDAPSLLDKRFFIVIVSRFCSLLNSLKMSPLALAVFYPESTATKLVNP